MYTKEQIIVGKRLSKWMYESGHVKTKADASLQTANLLNRYQLKHIKRAMEQATSLNGLKKILMRKDHFLSEINPKT